MGGGGGGVKGRFRYFCLFSNPLPEGAPRNHNPSVNRTISKDLRHEICNPRHPTDTREGVCGSRPNSQRVRENFHQLKNAHETDRNTAPVTSPCAYMALWGELSHEPHFISYLLQHGRLANGDPVTHTGTESPGDGEWLPRSPALGLTHHL